MYGEGVPSYSSLENMPYTGDITHTSWWWVILGVLCVAAVTTRLYRINEPDRVCWDEMHFGKMASWYINGTFFLDVHPPFGKMLIALCGKLTGYDGKFDFAPGTKYGNFKYVGMRMICTSLGALVIPLTFLTVWELTQSLQSALLSAMLILLDVGLLTLSRYILLDPILLFFMSISVYTTFKVSGLTAQGVRANDIQTLVWQTLLGTFLACTISVKFVGIFTVLFAGLRTVADLWYLVGELTIPVRVTVRGFLLRTVTLVVWPTALYLVFFWIHLSILRKSGIDDRYFSSEFQARLEGNSFHNTSVPQILAYGARISLKNRHFGGGYLHSHPHFYPARSGGIREQQITSFKNNEDNNQWIVLPYDRQKTSGIVIVRHGDLIRLSHANTGRNLHAHIHKALLTPQHFQVTGFGTNGKGDSGDIWKVLIFGGKKNEEVQTVRSKLILIHHKLNCALASSGKRLPKWGFKQHEIVCTLNLQDGNTLWNIENNEFKGLPHVNSGEYASGFLKSFLESHKAMLHANAGMLPRDGEQTSSLPWEWLINNRGQYFLGNPNFIPGHPVVYLLGNPVIWWTNLLSLVTFPIIFIVNAFRRQRGVDVLQDVHQQRLEKAAAWLFCGWAMHYVPFWAMCRVLYFHHYFPAYIFSTMLSGVIIEYFMLRIMRCLRTEFGVWLHHTALSSLLAAVAYYFYLLCPLAYGTSVSPAYRPEFYTNFSLMV